MTKDQAGSHMTRRKRVSAELRKMIVGPQSNLEERLPSVEVLAQQFDVSVGTMHLALGDLEAEGYVVKKHGSGMFVASRYAPMVLSDTAAVCMESGVHLYGELWMLLMQALQSRHMVPVGVDTAHGDAVELLHRLSHADVRYYLVHLASQPAWDIFQQPAFEHKPVISFFVTPSNIAWPGLYRIDTDLQAVADLGTDWLWKQGCRRLLILGTQTDADLVSHLDSHSRDVASSIARAWDTLGGERTFLASDDDPSTTSLIRFDEDQLVSLLQSPDAPDAIMGTRDVEVWEAQQVIQRRLPGTLKALTCCGVFDTPWSRTGSPPFSTVNVNLPAMADVAMTMLDALRAGKKPRKRHITVAPRLVIRSTT